MGGNDAVFSPPRATTESAKRQTTHYVSVKEKVKRDEQEIRETAGSAGWSRLVLRKAAACVKRGVRLLSQ